MVEHIGWSIWIEGLQLVGLGDLEKKWKLKNVAFYILLIVSLFSLDGELVMGKAISSLLFAEH